MATFTKVLLSGSAQGQPVLVAATASTGTTIHATGSSASVIDEIWLYATNTSNAPVTLTLQFGGTSSTVNPIPVVIPADIGMVLVVPGLVLTGTGSAASTVYAYASTTDVITLSGYVNRVS